MPKQITLDGWLLSHFQVLLKKGSSHRGKDKDAHCIIQKQHGRGRRLLPRNSLHTELTVM
ncbi:hypothetical protein DYY67_0541 [Candidatus Nitrosotalea sp. TS]|nr:hypothetical protein [Candidatus Nitrosotalea sp. TS]